MRSMFNEISSANGVSLGVGGELARAGAKPFLGLIVTKTLFAPRIHGASRKSVVDIGLRFIERQIFRRLAKSIAARRSTPRYSAVEPMDLCPSKSWQARRFFVLS